jgi:hypothetical protein
MFAVLHYLYLLRFPIACAALLAAFGPVALGPGRALLIGMFDLDWPGVSLATYCALWVGTASFFSAQLVLLYGHERFGAPAVSPWWGRALPFKVWQVTFSRIEGLVAGLGALAAMVLCGYLITQARPGAVLGSAIGLAIFVATLVLIERLRNAHFLMSWNTRVASWLAFTPQGYVKHRAAGPSDYQLLDAHGRALAVSLSSQALYVVLGLAKGIALGFPDTFARSESPAIPTLAGVLILILLVCWNGSALAFFLDRFRVPVMGVFVPMLVAAAQWPQSDHFFAVSASSRQERVLPRDVLDASPSEAAIVVAVSGGGIQASAWAAQVLTGLDAASGGRFAPSVRLISSVSGGSVGTMRFLAAYENGTLPDGAHQRIVEQSRASSLDEVAWGVLYPDLLRLVLPFVQPGIIDRGWALERAWAAGQTDLATSMSEWRQAVHERRMPAVMFNATVVETGGRVLFSTVDADRDNGARSADNFRDLYPQYDVAPVTAARLSASFPYVSPAARAAAPLPRSQRFHFVDGGYWDNFGIASAVEFIDQAVTAGTKVKRILLIEVHDRLSSSRRTSDGRRGALFQTFAPPSTLLSVMSNGQPARNAEEVRLLKGYLAARSVELSHQVFESPQASAPLSWHLTLADKMSIDRAWTAMTDRASPLSAFCQTLAFLQGLPSGRTGTVEQVQPCAR